MVAIFRLLVISIRWLLLVGAEQREYLFCKVKIVGLNVPKWQWNQVHPITFGYKEFDKEFEVLINDASSTCCLESKTMDDDNDMRTALSSLASELIEAVNNRRQGDPLRASQSRSSSPFLFVLQRTSSWPMINFAGILMPWRTIPPTDTKSFPAGI